MARNYPTLANLKRSLYHGTGEENVLKIAKSNFDWRLCGSNSEALYGEGVYFSTSARYSNDYAANNNGLRHMFLASVLVGDYTVGHKGLKRPPVKLISSSSSRGEIFYDCCVNNQLDPSIFVIFDFNHIYPTYLIKYTLSTSLSQCSN